jgi:hypothetical protein
LYGKDEGTSQDNQEKETSTEKVQRENKRRASGENNPGMGKKFSLSQNSRYRLWGPSRVLSWG